MKTFPPQNYLAWKISVSFLHLMAIGCAIYRLLHRYMIQRLWWDDYMVIVPLVLSLVYWPLFLVHFPYRLGGWC
ncbi:hypothetical protein CPB84DRAFT_1682717 [Gymnopilus junonius]|uniref:Uncharacterized protein n=1 Tax=Gymnopilus junonius TaxID=109634 RepID=A0A9P5TM11_GYMJU|nr:hypothetical protein CPB84DRAFT_1682717 [Gymnopilus junonius]